MKRWVGKANKKSQGLFSYERFVLFKALCQAGLAYLAVNFVVQLAKKPTEILSVAGFFKSKRPEETWRAYRAYFTDSASDLLSADYLAALAHQESGGNPWASPPWRVRLNSKVFDIYAPSTTAVGLYQFLDETYATVAGENPGTGYWGSRLSPQASTQVAARYLNREVERIRQEHGLRKLSAERAQAIASIVHLCGKGKAVQFVRSGFSYSRLGMCGAHSPQRYVEQVQSLKLTFATLRERDDRGAIASVR